MTENHGVGGSIPSLATILFKMLDRLIWLPDFYKNIESSTTGRLIRLARLNDVVQNVIKFHPSR